MDCLKYPKFPALTPLPNVSARQRSILQLWTPQLWTPPPLYTSALEDIAGSIVPAKRQDADLLSQAFAEGDILVIEEAPLTEEPAESLQDQDQPIGWGQV